MTRIGAGRWFSHRYYTLVASLPLLPRFDKAQRLPITRERLDKRLGMLAPEDFAIVRQAEQFLDWGGNPMGRSDADFIASHSRLLAVIRQPTLHEVVLYRMDVRTVLAALRHRQLGRRPQQSKTRWGIGPLTAHIEKHWQHSDFNLRARFPWVARAAALLQSGESLELEHLLLSRLWDFLDGQGRRHAFEFDFDFVLIYLFKWDLVNRWLGHDRAQALQRLEELRAHGIAACSEPLFARSFQNRGS